MLNEAWKITIITERILEHRLNTLLLESGCKGFTLFGVGGRGLHHFHAPEERGAGPEEFSEIQYEAVVRDRAVVESIARKIVVTFFDDFADIVFLERVEVVRVERF